MIPKDTIDKIFETARIEEVVGDFVILKRRGANLLGVCPFHNEKTPSFTVSPAKGIYKCFGCQKGGHSVDFIMNHEQLSYPEALKYLANKYNIYIEEKEATPEDLQISNERESLLAVSSFAQKHFTETLYNTDEGKSIGLSYFRERGFREDIIAKFNLGFSSEKRTALTDSAKQAGFKEEYVVKTGLTIKGERGNFDRFSGRVMFPIHNASGRVIAFGGRILRTDKKVAKYVNSPESDIYHKSNVLYGLYFSKKAIITEDNCLLVEGYTDVISLHQAGIENVVASSGTALTIEQIRLISRFTKNITILYDGDNAGIKASFRGINLILEEGLNVKVLLFPDGEDPDSYSKKVNSDSLRSFIKESSKDFITFKTDLLFKEAANDPIKKASLIREIVETIALIPDAISRSVYVKESSRILEVEEPVLISELNKLRRTKIEKGGQTKEEKIPVNDDPQADPALEEKNELSDLEHQEKDVIRLLINYFSREITIKGADGQLIKATAGEYTDHLVKLYELTFTVPAYAAAFKCFSEKLQMEEIPEELFFINHPDTSVSQLAVSLLSSQYELSANWLNKHHIVVISEEEQLSSAIEGAIYSWKIKVILDKINKNQERLKTATSEEECFQLIREQKELHEIKIQFSAELGRTLVK